jgi:dTDP-4-dehydrorhamnose reductase
MKILVIGGSGQVGQALFKAAQRQHWPATGTGFANADKPGHYFPPLKDLNILDHGAMGALVASEAPAAVFFPAGWTWVDGCEADEAKAMAINALAPEAAARAAWKAQAAFIFYSTEYLFDGAAGPYSEDAEPHPLGVYARSKLEAERRILAVHPKALILRTTVVYGPEPQGKNFIYQLIASLKAGMPMRIPQDQVSNPTYNYDLARASLELARFGMGGVFNVVGEDRVGRLDFAQEACRVFGLDASLLQGVSTASLKQRAARPLNAGLTTHKLRQALGWAPRGIRSGLQAMQSVLDGGSGD